ncbi:MAG TPA: PAS domain-containing sensor histidine kinase [Longimicrobiaceae bacterium]|nr:PAS domain-containing sensor histidine kinase [Longimicrobiaceae bacterium]
MDELLNTAPCGFLGFGDDGTVGLANDTLLEMLGYGREEVVGRHVEHILTVGSRIFYQTHLFPLLRLHGRAEEIFLLLRARSGESVGVLANAVRRERGGRAVYDCVVMRVRERQKFEDELLRARRVAEQARAELEAQALEMELQQQQLEEQTAELELAGEELRVINEELIEKAEEAEQLRAAAEEANRAKSTFLAVMSHELRTPLNAIAGYLQILEMGIHGPVTDAQREALGRIDRSQRHLLRLINDVLNLARIEAGRVDYLVEDVPVGEVVAAVTPMVEPQYASKGVALAAEVAPDLVARADHEKVQQVLLNLLSNAVKFTPAGGRVGVEAVRSPDAPDRLLLRVRDTGTGIPPDKLEAVFQPFVQVDVSRTRSAQGTGLGLAISRDLARGMGGDLTAESTPGEGSTFTLALPLAPEVRPGAGADGAG